MQVRRVNYLRLTPKGAAHRKKVSNFIQALQKTMMTGIKTEEESKAIYVPKKVWRNLKEKDWAI
jgi:DNA-binding MarR family transcriptional regulator